MMNRILFLFLLLFSCSAIAQNPIADEVSSRLVDLHEVGNENENFEGFDQIKNDIGDARIVMLGEQSHTDATTFETKIKLIKYLHQEMGFDILAFESGLYDCDKAWSMIQQGHDVKDAIGSAIISIWSGTEELIPLYNYFEQELATENPLRLVGFDSQFIGKLSLDFFAKDLRSYLASFEDAVVHNDDISHLGEFIKSARLGKRYKKKKAKRDIAFLDKLISMIGKEEDNALSEFWCRTLESLKVSISDSSLGTDDRDQKMAKNLVWLKEKYPEKKIICWGATSHFLYNSSLIKLHSPKMQKAVGDYYLNHKMMGDYIKEKYGEEVYTIGFIAHEGFFGYNRVRSIKSPEVNSLEHLVGLSPEDNYFLPLSGLKLEGLLSRPLAHQYMLTDIAQVMDGVVFNRKMRRPQTDWEFMLYLVPENKMRAKKKEKFVREYKLRKEKEEALRLKKQQRA